MAGPTFNSSKLSGAQPATHLWSRTDRMIMVLLGIRLLYGGLAALALPLMPALIYILNILFDIFTYLVTALLIWSERHVLSDYRIGKLAVILFIASVPYLLLIAVFKVVPYPFLLNALLLPISIVLAVKFYKEKQLSLKNPANLGRWLLAGAAIGTTLGALAGLLIALQPDHLIDTTSILNIILQPTFQLSSAGVYEEPLFRGFLWTFLYRKGWKNGWIWIFQAGLFCLGHVYYIPTGDIYSLGTSLAAGLVLGWVAWKARDISASMIAHGMCNAVAQLVADLAAGR
jgi:membrane protease YdiL (CAAX protease family)